MQRVLIRSTCQSHCSPVQYASVLSQARPSRPFPRRELYLPKDGLASNYTSESIKVHEFFNQAGGDHQIRSCGQTASPTSVTQNQSSDPTSLRPEATSSHPSTWPELSTPRQIRFEADVLGKRLNSTQRLVDDERHVNNHELWLTLLRFRRNTDGNQGVWDVFNGMRDRNVELPMRGDVADRLWGLLIYASVESDNLDQLWSYATDLYKQHGRRWEHLYRKIMSTVITRDPGFAMAWHHKLVGMDLPATGDLKDLVLRIPPNDVNINILERICHSEKSRKIYDEVVPALLGRGEYAVALRFHRILTVRRDYPSNGQLVAPLVTWLAGRGRAFEAHEVARYFATTTVPLKQALPNSRRRTAKFQPTMDEVFAEKSRISRETSGETVCARAYATRMFSVSIISATLSAWGIRDLGPVAFRELIARCDGISEIYENLNHLKVHGINVQPCSFTNLILKLADEGNMDMISNVISSDQHPDTYEDVALLERLLEKYVSDQDMASARRILAALSFQQWDRRTEVWNRLLRACFSHDTRNWELINHILDEMLSNNVPVDGMTGIELYYKLIASYTTFDKSSGTDLIATMELAFKITKAGHNVLPVIGWKTLIYHLGKESRLASLEYLCLQLATVLDPSKTESALKPSVSPNEVTSNPHNPHRPPSQLSKLLGPPSRLTDILDEKLRHDIIMWGFKTLDRNNRQTKGAHVDFAWPQTNMRGIEAIRRDASYARGVALLLVLKRLHKLPVLTQDVSDACRLRLLVLFAPYRRLERASRTARKLNPWTLRQMVRKLNAVWDTPVFDVPASLLEELPAPAPGASIDELAALADVERVAERRLKNRVLGRNWETALRGYWTVVDKRRVEQMSYRIVWH